MKRLIKTILSLTIMVLCPLMADAEECSWEIQELKLKKKARAEVNPDEENIIYLDIDMTSGFTYVTQASNWTNFTGGQANSVGWAAPQVTLNTGAKVAVCEFYDYSYCASTGDMLYQTLTGLTKGTYKIELYGASAFTYNRGFGSMAFTGDLSVDHNDVYHEGDKIVPSNENTTGVSITATTSEGTYGKEIPIWYATSFNPDGPSTIVLEGVEVGDDGNVKLSMTKNSQSTNWHVIQLKGIARQINAKEALAEAVSRAAAVDKTKLSASLAEELDNTVAEYNKSYNTAEEYETAIKAIDYSVEKMNRYIENPDENDDPYENPNDDTPSNGVIYESDFDHELTDCIPTGWITYNEAGYHVYGFIDEARTQQFCYGWGGNPGGGGSRLYAGFSGDFNKGVYWGTRGTIEGWASYGELVKDWILDDGTIDPNMPDGISLYLTPKSYQVDFQMAAWKGEPQFTFTLEDLDGNVYATLSDCVAAPNMNGQIGGFSETPTYSTAFSIPKAGYYVIRFTSGELAWQEFILAKVTLSLYGIEDINLNADVGEVYQGEEIPVSINLNNEMDIIMAEFYMQLPEGFKIAMDDEGYYLAEINSERSNRHQLEVACSADGIYHFLCYSSNNNAFKNNSGELIHMTLVCDEGIEPGTYQGEIKDIILADANKLEINPDDFAFDIVLKDYTMGDVNGDTRINGLDIVEMVDKIMDRPSDYFIFAAGDFDGNGKINGMDLVEEVALVMSQTASGVKSRKVPEKLNQDMASTMRLHKTSDGRISVGMDSFDAYILSQFVVELSDGQQLTDITASDTHHTVAYQPIDGHRYAVVCYSTRNVEFSDNNDMLKISCEGSGTVRISDVMLVDADRKTHYIKSAELDEATGIDIVNVNGVFSKPTDIYSVYGALIKKNARSAIGLSKGIYVVDGKSVFIK